MSEQDLPIWVANSDQSLPILPLMNTAHDTLDRLNAELGARIAERQSLRATGADGEALECNRIEICTLQQLISRALIACYLQAPAQAA